ncbi:hypothetical protein L6164_025538 [Bauhinia variegata]|uniref:Uncharacterized protein n=1 Tax=Bauhinia variegata TaxID=167791 RepID=A0ACB9M174_BAUVA|nr:hypothetical protein L6164_025538 [Bauhinia variegata]
MELQQYMPSLGDFMHAFLSTTVFAVLGLLDTNTVLCFYPQFQMYGRTLLQVMAPVILVIACWLCNWFPSNRHGLGNPPAPVTPHTETAYLHLT